MPTCQTSKSFRAATIALLLLTGELHAQLTRDQARQADLNSVATEIPKRHANFFFQLNPNDYNNAVSDLRAQIPALTDAEFYVGLARLIAMAGDAHTLIYLNAAASVAGFRQLPLEFRWLDEGVFVTGAAPDYSRALGTRLIGVGDLSIDDVVQKLGAVIPHSNSQWLRYMAQDYLRGRQVLEGLHIVPAGTASRFRFRTLGGEEFSLDVSPSSTPLVSALAPDQGPLPLYLQRANENYWFAYLAASRTMYFKYNRCVDTPGRPFSAFAADLFRTFDANPVDTVVFDFRGNTGGDSGLIQALTDGFIARIPVFVNTPGFRVYDVIDKGTFSSGLDDAMLLKTPSSEYAPGYPGFDSNKVIRVIGEPTGGAPSGYGEVIGFTLPNSKLVGQYSTTFFQAPEFITTDFSADGPSFGPEIAVHTGAADFFARHDPVLAAIVARFEGAASAPSGAAITVNGASFRIEQGLAPGSFASTFGSFSAAVDGVLVNGQPGRVVGAAQSQVNFVVPASVTPGAATISVRSGSNEIASGKATITSAGPGIFILAASDPSQPGAVLNEDSSVNSASHRAARSSVLQIFATGYGPLDSSGKAPVQVFLGEQSADVLFSGPISQFPGLWQINARVPSGVSGQVALFVIAEHVPSNGATVWIQ
jgi:uncharacterized protein (TIGR03437 family)